jgi:hypothetical protein
MATYVPTSWALHPVGARVWLPKERRYGRVVVRAQGGLLYRIRPEGAEREQLLERSTCELVTVSEDGWDAGLILSEYIVKRLDLAWAYRSLTTKWYRVNCLVRRLTLQPQLQI